MSVVQTCSSNASDYEDEYLWKLAPKKKTHLFSRLRQIKNIKFLSVSDLKK